MSTDDQLLGVIEAMYDAALDETGWPKALQQLTDLTGSQAATFWVLDSSDEPRYPIFRYINLDPTFVQNYLDEAAPLDPTAHYLVRHPRQAIVHDGLVISEREKDRDPCYDWLGRYSDLRFRMVGQVCPAPAVHAGVALHRSRAIGRYEPTDIEQFRILYPHLERALTIGFRLGTLGAMQQCTTDLLDRSPAAIVLLDARRRIVYTNSCADRLRSTGDGILLTREGITLLCRRDNDRLQGLIAQALSPVALPSASVAMRAERPSGKRPYAILVAPVSKEYPALSALRPAVCVIISDPESRKPLPAHQLHAVFGLTPAEGQLAVLLAAGEELRPAAEQLGITYGTARIRLGEIFQKTETRRQGELVKLLLTTLVPPG